MEDKQMSKQELQTLATEAGLILPKNTADLVFNTLTSYQESGRLVTPANYSMANALKGAWLIIQQTEDKNQQPVTETCSKESIANALLEMVILGLSPTKSQCYFVPYLSKTPGKKGELTLMPSYFGKQAALKRVKGVEAINAQVIYEGDKFSYETRSNGTHFNVSHEQDIDNINENNIKGAYCVITFKGEEYAFIQTFAQIQEAWKGAKQKGYDKKHFRAEFSKRTVINLAVKHFLQTTDDESLLAETIITNEHQHYEFDNVIDGEVNDVTPEPKQVGFEETADGPTINVETDEVTEPGETGDTETPPIDFDAE